MIAIGASQLFGYWGPDYPTLAGGSTTAGVLYRNDMTRGSNDFLPSAELVVRESKRVMNRPIRERSCLTLMIPDRLGVLPTSDPKFGGTANTWKDVLANIWFHSLTKSYTRAAKEQAYMTPNIADASSNEESLADKISITFDKKSVCVFSSHEVNQRLNSLNPEWITRDFED